ncbi:MAG: group III truncated hemoglobin [Bdellovibrionales bacterium]|nr:group III truncated hemoglobin [Bdellovibrionales bacterium]
MKERKEKLKDSSVTVLGVKFGHSDIHSVVDAFYKEVAGHIRLKVPFKSVQDWPEHIDRMTQFWWVSFGGKAYMFSQYSPVWKHYGAGFNQEYLDDWLKLFHKTLKEHLNIEQMMAWKKISERMGKNLLVSNEMIKAQKNENF